MSSINNHLLKELVNTEYNKPIWKHKD